MTALFVLFSKTFLKGCHFLIFPVVSYRGKNSKDGYIIQLDYTAVKEQTAEIQKVGVNVNQIAKRVNSTGNAYKEDLEEIKGALEKIWQLQRYTLSKLR